MLFAGGEAEKAAGNNCRKQGVQGKFIFHFVIYNITQSVNLYLYVTMYQSIIYVLQPKLCFWVAKL